MFSKNTTEESIPLVGRRRIQDTNNNTTNSNTTDIGIDMSDFPRFRNIFITLVGIIFVMNVLSQLTFVVQPGNIGLIVTLGEVVAVQSGLHFKYPFVSEVITFTAKTQKLEESNNTPTKEGLSVQLDTAMYVSPSLVFLDLLKD